MTPNDSNSSSGGRPGERPTLRPGWMSRLPSHILGGFRTTTVGLLAFFVVLVVIYLGVRIPPVDNPDSAVYTPPAPTTTTNVPQETYVPTATRAPTTTPSTTSTTEPTETVVPTPPATGSTSTGTTTQAPAFQLPTIPGLTLPTAPN